MQDSESALKKASAGKEFFFFTDVGKYTGKSASSLNEFAEEIKEVDAKSLRFHLNRGDFEKWIREVLKDQTLAGEMKVFRETTFTSDEVLRDRLYLVVSKRVEESGMPQTREVPIGKMQPRWKKNYS